jgi:hypothetical protein
VTKKQKQNQQASPDLITFTRITAFERCPMLDYYQYGVNGTGVESTIPFVPFIEGDFGHYAVAMFYKSGMMLRANMVKRVTEIMDELKRNNLITPETDDELRVSLAAMLGACGGYRDKYKPDLDKFEVVAVETPFEYELEGFKLGGKIDRILREKSTGDLMVWETKWVGGITQGAYAALPMSLQDLLYCEGCKVITGKYPKFRCRDFIQKSRLRVKSDKAGGKESLVQYETRVQQQYMEEPDKMFWRPPPQVVLPEIVEAVKTQVIRLLQFREGVRENPFMSFECLGMYGQPCPFIPACTAKLSGHADGWNAPECRGAYRLKKVLNPELNKSEA